MRFPASLRLAPLFLALALTACGGGGGKKAPPADSPPPAGKTTPLDGTVNKGLVLKSKVEIFEIGSGGSLSLLTSAVTDEQGQYKATLPVSYKGGPLKVVSSVDSSSQMICDAPAGCGGTSKFGERIALESGFKLSAVHPGTTPGQALHTHINPFTSFAAALSEKRGLTADNIRASNSQVQALFGLGADATQQAAVDITQMAKLGTINESSLKQQLLAAGLMGALQNNGQGASWSARLDDLVSRFANQNGQLVINDAEGEHEADLLSIEDILQQAQATAAHLADSGQTIPALRASMALLQLDTAAAQQQQEGTLSQSQPLPTVNANRLGKAKALINDIRTVALASNLEKLQVGAAQFKDQIELAAAASNAYTDKALRALQYAAEALTAAAGAYQDDDTLRSFTLQIPDNEILTVAITPQSSDYAQKARFTLKQDIQGNTVELSATVGLTETAEDNDADQIYRTSIDATLDLSGQLENSGINIKLEKVKYLLTYKTEGRRVDEQYTSIGFGDHQAELQVILSQKASANVSDPVTFTGLLSWTANGYSHAYSYDHSYERRYFIHEQSKSLDNGQIALKGKFANSQHHLEAFFDATLDGHGENNAVRIGERFTQNWENGDFEVKEEELGETETNYLAFDANLGFIANLPGVDGTSKILFNAKRTAFKAGTAALTLQFFGKQLVLSTARPLATPHYTLRNQDGVELQFNHTNSTLNGALMVEGQAQGSLEKSGNIILIRYKDGSFESLN